LFTLPPFYSQLKVPLPAAVRPTVNRRRFTFSAAVPTNEIA